MIKAVYSCITPVGFLFSFFFFLLQSGFSTWSFYLFPLFLLLRCSLSPLQEFFFSFFVLLSGGAGGRRGHG
jgi:hypothetical protein